MSKTYNADDLILAIVACLLIGILFGAWYGEWKAERPEEVYVFESDHPIRPIFDEKIPGRAEYQVIEYEDAYYSNNKVVRDQYLIYYWIEEEYGNQELHWTWRRITGP